MLNIMIKKISIALGIGFLAIAGVVSADASKTLLCHKTNSETNPSVIISVSENAVPAQLAEGSTFAVQLPDGSYSCQETDPGPGPV